MTTKPRLANFTDVRPDKASKMDTDGDSVISFASGPVHSNKLAKFAWGANEKASYRQQQLLHAFLPSTYARRAPS